VPAKPQRASNNRRPAALLLVLLVLLALLAGCAGGGAERDAQRLAGEGRYEEAIRLLEDAGRANPDSHDIPFQTARVKELAVSRLLAQAESARPSAPDAAEVLYKRVQGIDPANQRARGALERLATDRRHLAQVAEANEQIKRKDYAAAARTLQAVLTENPNQREALAARRRLDDATYQPPLAPRLGGNLTNPISLQFRDANLRSVLDVLSRAAGINFVLDKDVRPDLKTTITVQDTPIADVVRMMLLTNQLDQKVVNQSTILIYPNTPQKQREYQELVVRTFYISNADAKQTLNLLKTIIKVRDAFVDEKLNMVVVRDTPEVVRMAERLIAAQDLAEPEVMLEVEVLEISRSKLQQIGLQWPSSLAYSLVGGGAQTLSNGTLNTAAGTPGVLSLAEWLNRNSGLVRLSVSDPLFLASLQQQITTANLLANPRIRVKNREKASIHIGDRVPVITTTAAVTGGFVSQSVNYIDVGLKLEVEPVVNLDDDVSIKLGLEVSRITSQVSIPGSSAGSGTLAYQIGTRKANSVLRLHDGETQVLAGLIDDEDRGTTNQVPGLGDFPVLGRLFSNRQTNPTRTEVMLLITPHVVRGLARPEARFAEFPAGTEASGGSAPIFSPPASPAPAPAPVPAPAPAAPLVPPGAPGPR
jgi:general secretion pathway protein D